MAEDITLGEVIRESIEAKLDEVMTSTIGKIVKYDMLTQTADVKPVIRRAYNIGQGLVDFEELPIIPNVMIRQPRAGGFFIHMPVKEGDHVLLVFPHDDIGPWRENGTESEPQDLRRHSLGPCIGIVGVADALSPLNKTDPLELAAREAGLVVGKDGSTAQVQWDDEGIKFGRPAVSPIALAVPTDAAIANLQAQITSLANVVAGVSAVANAAFGAVGTHTHPVTTTGTETAQAGTAAAAGALPAPPAPGAAPTVTQPTTASGLVKST